MGINYNILNKCIQREDILEELYYINGSLDFYITKTIDIYKYYNGYGYYKMSQRINKNNGYVYCSVKYKDDAKNISQRVHRIVANTFIHNDDPERKLIVGHKNNIKHDNRIDNLYWTTNQENTKKAVDDGLSIQAKGINNDNSNPVLVTDLKNNPIAVYGSMREASNMIKNLSIGYLGKILKNNKDYKPRNKSYKYFKITKEQYLNYDYKYKNINLIEKPTMKKQCRIFKAINVVTGEEVISDNQKKFANDYNLKQTNISYALINKTQYENWVFEILENIPYKESSAYVNYIDTCDSITIKNIETNEELEFDNSKQVLEHFGFVGHGLKQYIKRNNLLFSKWKIIKVNDLEVA